MTHEIKHVLWMYFNNCAILVYKGAPATSHIYADAPPPAGASRFAHLCVCEY